MKPALKITLSILFFLCLLKMPYGYYELVRMIALIGFCLLAYDAFTNGKMEVMILYIGLAILFQPIFKIALGRTLWNIVDIIVGAGLLVSVWMDHRKE